MTKLTFWGLNMKKWLLKLAGLIAGIEELKEELDKAKNSGKKINPKKVLKLIKYEKQMIELAKKQSFRNLKEICDENQTKYTDWIPLTPAEKLAEDAKHEPSISSEQLQNMKDVFNIEVDAVDDTVPKYHE